MIGWGIACALLALTACLVVYTGRAERERLARAARIDRYVFPIDLMERLQMRQPTLDERQREMAFRALRQYFQLVALNGGDRSPLIVPSRVVDEIRRDFARMTPEYAAFCREAFGTRGEAPPQLPGEPPLQTTVRDLALTHAALCRHDVRRLGWTVVANVPLLFAVDALLGIEDGYLHTAESLDKLRQEQSALYDD